MSNPADTMKENTVEYQPKQNGIGDNGHQEVKTANSLFSTWDDPILPSKLNLPELSPSLLPDWVGDYVDAVAKETQTPSGLGVMLALSVLATCLQKRFVVHRFGDHKETLSLWTVTAMPPASRKTAVYEALTAPLISWETKQGELLEEKISEVDTKRAVNRRTIDRLESDAAKEDDSMKRAGLMHDINKLKSEMPDEIKLPRLWTGDITPERLQGLMAEHGERMGILADEGGIFEIMSGLYSDGRANLDIFLKSHVGSSVRVDRGKRAATLHSPALSFGLAVQPYVLEELGKGNKRRFRGIGTLARFLYCIPASNIGTRDVRQKLTTPDSVKQAYKDNISELLEIQPRMDSEGVEVPQIIRLSPEALSSWESFADFVESKQGEGGEFEPIQDWSGKLPGVALRIAGLYHVAKYKESSFEIDLETMEAALDICEALIPHAQAALDLITEDQADSQAIKDAAIICEWIAKRGEPSFKRSECHTAHKGRFRKVDRLIAALKVAQGQNIISELDTVKVENSNKPILLHHVNPKYLLEAKNGLA